MVIQATVHDGTYLRNVSKKAVLQCKKTTAPCHFDNGKQIS